MTSYVELDRRFTCGHILHWYLRPGPPPFDRPPILVAFIGCGTTNRAAGVPGCAWPPPPPPPPPPPGDELFDEPDRSGPVAP